MKIEITEEGVVFCDTLTCESWRYSQFRCENCILFEIIQTFKQNMID